MDPMGFLGVRPIPKIQRRIVCQATAACVGLMVWSEPPGERQVAETCHVTVGNSYSDPGLIFRRVGIYPKCWYPKDHWTLKTGYFEDPTPAIQVQTLPLEGPRWDLPQCLVVNKNMEFVWTPKFT